MCLLKKNIFNGYSCQFSSDDYLDGVGDFLATDGYYAASEFLQWLKTTKEYEDSSGSNLTNILKVGDDIIVEEAFSDDEGNSELILKTTLPEMISILEQWVVILAMKSRPIQVEIIQDANGKVVLVPSKD